jgi:hypothetical protein
MRHAGRSIGAEPLEGMNAFALDRDQPRARIAHGSALDLLTGHDMRELQLGLGIAIHPLANCPDPPPSTESG